MSSLRVEQVVTEGVFSIDGEDFAVANNIWLIGDDHEVLVVDAAHDAEAITRAVGDRRLVAVVCTHGHNDHINAAVDLRRTTGAPVLLHPADEMLWSVVHPGTTPDGALAHGQELTVAGRHLRVAHTPGHSPGGICLVLPGIVDGPEASAPTEVFGGDTLFQGGPGATGRSFSDFPTLIDSIRRELFVLDGSTIVRTGHGDSTTIGAERPHLDEWIARGH